MLDRLARSLGERGPALVRTFGVSGLYTDWTSNFVRRATERNVRNYSGYVDGAVAGMRALEGVIWLAAEQPVEELTPESFVSEFVGGEVRWRARSAIERLLAGDFDIFLRPRPGGEWTELDGVRLPRRRPDLVEVTELQRPNLRLLTSRSSVHGDIAPPGTGLIVVEPSGATQPRGPIGWETPIVVELGEVGERLEGEFGRSLVTPAIVHFGYEDIDLLGVEGTGGVGRQVRALQLGDELTPGEARALTQAQKQWHAWGQGIVTASTVPNLVEQALSSLADLPVTARRGAEDVLESFADVGPTGPLPAAFAAEAAQEIRTALEDQLGTLEAERPPPKTPRRKKKTGDRELRKLALEVRGALSDAEPLLVLVKLALPASVRSQYESQPFKVKLRSPMVIELAVSGFEVIGNSSEELRIERGVESPTYAFKLKVLDVPHHSVVIRAVQDRKVLQQLEITTFPDSLEADIIDVTEPSVDLRVRIDENGVVTFWDSEGRQVRCGGRLKSDAASRDRLDKLGREIDAKSSSWDDERFERDLVELGQLACMELPDELVDALSKRTGLSVHIHHPEQVDFPFELALLSVGDSEVFLGEAHPVTRWIDECVGTAIHPDQRSVSRAAVATIPRVREVAEPGYSSLEDRLRELCEVEPFEAMGLVEQEVLRTDRFQILDVVSHLQTSAVGEGLELTGGLLRVASFRKPQSVFCSNAALVFLNACSSGGGVPGPFGIHTYAKPLLKFGVGAVVASTLPVNVKVAVSMSRHIYEGLASGSGLGQALLDARLATIEDEGTGKDRGTRRLTALAYCAFGHPDMTITLCGRFLRL